VSEVEQVTLGACSGTSHLYRGPLDGSKGPEGESANTQVPEILSDCRANQTLGRRRIRTSLAPAEKALSFFPGSGAGAQGGLRADRGTRGTIG
jgi:hypothetical protein